MDVVIPYKKSVNDDNELRFALRSIEKWLPERENVFIIGYHPKWLQNIICIPASEPDDVKLVSRNIFSKVMLACNDKRVSDDFLFTNDDIFLLETFDGEYHHKGTLANTFSTLSLHQSYRWTITNTLGILQGGNDFDTHAPIVYNKEMFLRSVGRSFTWPAWGYCIKSLYCNLCGIDGMYYPDLKIKKQLKETEIRNAIAGRPYFSTGDHAINHHMRQVLTELFPNKSIYESDTAGS